MIPSDHFVRYYNEVFKELYALGREHLVNYWRELGREQAGKLGGDFRRGGLRACYDYWKIIEREENCEAELSLTDDYFEFRMKKCPSLTKVFDNDAGPFELYCDHCMGWIQPVMEYAGLYAVMNMVSRRKPECVFRVYIDEDKAEEFASEAKLLSRPYD